MFKVSAVLKIKSINFFAFFFYFFSSPNFCIQLKHHAAELLLLLDKYFKVLVDDGDGQQDTYGFWVS